MKDKLSFLYYLYHIIKGHYRKYKIFQYIKKMYPTTVIDDNVNFLGDIKNLHLGKNVVFQSNTVIDLGGTTKWCDYKGYLEIGDDSIFAQGCIIYAAGPYGVKIGKRLDCGPGVRIFASRTDYERGINHHIFAPVQIGDDVVIFANAVICPGVKVGSGAVIAAGSVVLNDVPDYNVFCGIPARFMKKIDKK